MFASLAEAAMSLDIGTLFVITICVTSLLGLFLLFAWLQDGITSPEAEEKAKKAGLLVVSNDCMMREHGRRRR